MTPAPCRPATSPATPPTTGPATRPTRRAPPPRPRRVPLAQALRRGFTLVEMMVVVAVVALLTTVALPAYQQYVVRSKVPAGLDALQAYFTRMEQRFQDAGSYANGTACALSLPPNTDSYTYSCALTGGGSGYTATATGTGRLAGYAYTINDGGTRNTTAHPVGLPSTACWTVRGSQCDT